MARIKEVEQNVQYVLEKHPQTRGDDFQLVGFVWIIGYGLDPLLSWSSVFGDHKELGLPSWGSITRARRKLQAEFPELRADDDTEDIRMKEQEKFIAYALDEEV